MNQSANSKNSEYQCANCHDEKKSLQPVDVPGEEEKKVRLIDSISTALPSAILFIGLIMLAVANPYGDYFIGVGVIMQVVFLVFRVPKLFSSMESAQSGVMKQEN
jgi:hypothetical protein